jgi:hypothetical protein
MTSCDDCFQDFLHPIVHDAIDKNNRFKEKYGQFERWDWDSESATLTFSNSGQARLRVSCAIVGTTEGDSWEWAWANPTIRDFAKLNIDQVRVFGEDAGFEKLTSKFLEADEFTGWEMTAVAVHILNAFGSYRFPTDEGYCYLAYTAIDEFETNSNIH